MKQIRNQATVPCAFITKRKQRIKQNNKAVYLNNGDEFEIELFNPTTNKILAEIQLNGKNISDGGIVLRPGERVFLERFIDTRRKFLFETYNVSGDSKLAKQAIKDNGNVFVKFYDEAPPIKYSHFNTTYLDIPYYPNYGPTYGFDNTGSPTPHTFFTSSMCCDASPIIGSTLTNSMSPSIEDGNAVLDFLSQERNMDLKRFRSNLGKQVKGKKKEPIETGRIEKGSRSHQSFVKDDTKFNSYPSWESEWQIYPTSQKRRTIQEINQIHCTECGTKKTKSSHKFCPRCGTQYE